LLSQALSTSSPPM